LVFDSTLSFWISDSFSKQSVLCSLCFVVDCLVFDSTLSFWISVSF
jgi:hypothetical protein